MKPYFGTHAVGLLLLLVVMAWGAMELSQYSQGVDARKGATRVGRPSWRLATWACLIAANVVLYLAPHIVPAAAIRPGAVTFTAGMVVLLAGVALRGWSFKTLGDYFTFTVMVSSDQPVVARGPYRVLRHPGYTGLLLACAGVGLTAANWASVAGMTLLPLAAILWRIHIEEGALLTTLGDRYRCYALGTSASSRSSGEPGRPMRSTSRTHRQRSEAVVNLLDKIAIVTGGGFRDPNGPQPGARTPRSDRGYRRHQLRRRLARRRAIARVGGRARRARSMYPAKTPPGGWSRKRLPPQPAGAEAGP